MPTLCPLGVQQLVHFDFPTVFSHFQVTSDSVYEIKWNESVVSNNKKLFYYKIVGKIVWNHWNQVWSMHKLMLRKTCLRQQQFWWHHLSVLISIAFRLWHFILDAFIWLHLISTESELRTRFGNIFFDVLMFYEQN